MGIFRQAYITDKEDELKYFLFIAQTGCIGINTYTKMQHYFDSPKAFYKASRETLVKSKAFTEKQIERIEAVRREYDLTKWHDYMLKENIKLIPYEAFEYPKRLMDIKDPPPVLFLKGKLPIEALPCASIIGTRECSVYGSNVAKRLGELMAENNVSVVSGMARGIDSLSQRACMEAGGYSLALLGGGVDIIYPRESKELYKNLCEMGGILSEFPPGTAPKRPFFALRNRLISGLSDVVCVIEAKEKSGTLITVDCALDQGREVYVVPGRITDLTSMGTNELIRQGAGIIADLDGFVEEFLNNYSESKGIFAKNVENKTKASDIKGFNNNELKIIGLLDENSFTADKLSENINLPSYEILSLCISLSTKGILNIMGGGRFVATSLGIDVRNVLLKEKNEEE